jgi:hypothetical protein
MKKLLAVGGRKRTNQLSVGTANAASPADLAGSRQAHYSTLQGVRMNKETWESIRDFFVQYPLYQIADFGVTGLSAIGWWTANTRPKLSLVFLGGVLAGLSILFISWAPTTLSYFGLLTSRSLADDAVKWKISKHLRDDFTAIPTVIPPQIVPCQMVIVHYQSEYSEDLTQSLSDILTFAGCGVRDFYSETMSPSGITLKLAKDTREPLKSYLAWVKDRLKGDAGVVARDDPTQNPVFHIPAQRPIAANGLYGEIIIGNRPQ